MRISPTNKVWTRRSAPRGFTLIEMVVVTTIIVVIAALVAPNLVTIQRSRELSDEKANLVRLPTEARNQAIKLKAVVDLRVDGDNMVMESTNAQTSDVTEIKRVPLGQMLQVTGAQSGSDTSDLASWKWKAYPDGTSDSGGLTFHVGDNGQGALWMPAEGAAQWTTGELPQPKDNSWAAGDIVQRTTSATSSSGGGTVGR